MLRNDGAGGLATLPDEMGAELRGAVRGLLIVVRGEGRRQNWGAGGEVRLHKARHLRPHDEIVPVDSTVHFKYGAIARSCDLLLQKRTLEGNGDVEDVDLVRGDVLAEARKRLVDNVCVPLGLEEGETVLCDRDLFSTRWTRRSRDLPAGVPPCATHPLSSGL